MHCFDAVFAFYYDIIGQSKNSVRLSQTYYLQENLKIIAIFLSIFVGSNPLALHLLLTLFVPSVDNVIHQQWRQQFINNVQTNQGAKMKTTTKKMKKYGYFAGVALAIIFLILSSPSAFGQVMIVENENEPAREVERHGGKYTFDAGNVADTVDIKGVSTTLFNYGQFKTVNVREGASNIVPTGYLGDTESKVDTLNIYEGRAESKGQIDTVNIGIGTGSTLFYNDLTGTVGTLNMSDQGSLRIDLGNSGFIDTFNMNGTGTGVFNNSSGHINTANINGKNFHNYGSIDTMNVGKKGSETYNRSGTIDKLNMDGGLVYNYGLVNTASVTGEGFFSVREGSTTGTVDVSGNGILSNRGAIQTVNFNGGTVENVGRIDEMTYTKGTYKTHMQYYKETGRIGTLTAAGTLQAAGDWGLVENLNFQNDRSGQVNIDSYTSQWGTGFSGVKADNVDFSFGNILLDVSRIFAFDPFDDWFLSFVDMNLKDDISFATLFNAEEVANAWDLNSFTVSWGDELSYGILNNGKFAKGWGFNSNYTWFVYSDNSTSESATPEPATLAMLGLGLVGLPLVYRLRKKQIVK